jgi:tRNA A37 threonylcarbamoyladenosine modification protein TsaB
MKLFLAIEASSSTYAVALGAGEAPLVHRACSRDDPSFRGVGELVSSSLAGAGFSFADIGSVGVDIGPGNLSSVRAAVAYANGLAFSLGLMVFCANSLELMAADSHEIQACPALCLRIAGGGNVYAGLFDGSQAPQLRHGRLESTVTAMVGDLGKVCVAGAYRQAVADLAVGSDICDTGIEAPNVVTLYRMLSLAGDTSDRLVPLASPLNEGSRVFHA